MLGAAALMGTAPMVTHAQEAAHAGGGLVASASLGIVRAWDYGRRPPTYAFSAGWQQPFSRHLSVRGALTRLKALHGGDRNLLCPINPQTGQCGPDPEFPSVIWSAEGALLVSPSAQVPISLVLGSGAALPRGNLERPHAEVDEAIRPVWRVGVEAAPAHRLSVQVAHSWYGQDIIAVNGVTTLGLMVRFR
jgi:hypothetical protein